jgi:hypothetical protein
MKSAIVFIMLAVLSATSLAQPLSEPAPRPPIAEAFTGHPTENKDDPGYNLYREGYNLILKEKWDQAGKTFAELIAKYPRSEFVDDAAYWSAYALKHTNRKKALDAYRAFLERYTQSSYYDDAVADLTQLETTPFVFAPVPPRMEMKNMDGEIAYAYSISANARRMAREIKRQQRKYRIPSGSPVAPFMFHHHEKLDPETRLKMEALYALGETKEDERSYQTLREVALDMQQHPRLREAALDALSEYTKHDVLPIYIEIARKDTSRRLQTYAIDYIADVSRDKNKSVDLLIDLFKSFPRDRKEQMASVFYSIAEVGNDKAVDFLTDVALKHHDYDMRSEAVYYLGSIGGEKARAALYQILKKK